MKSKTQLATTIATAIITIPLLFSLTGCVIAIGEDRGHGRNGNWQQRQEDNSYEISNLATGMAFDQVRERLGQPDFTEAFEHEGVAVTVLFYRTDSVHSDGVTTKDECTPLVFKNKILTGWGKMAYQHI